MKPVILSQLDEGRDVLLARFLQNPPPAVEPAPAAQRLAESLISPGWLVRTSCPFYSFIRGPDLIPRHSPRQHPAMLLPFFRCLVSAFKTRRELALENLTLRQQLAVLRRSVKRPHLSDFDHGFRVLLSRIWRD